MSVKKEKVCATVKIFITMEIPEQKIPVKIKGYKEAVLEELEFNLPKQIGEFTHIEVDEIEEVESL